MFKELEHSYLVSESICTSLVFFQPLLSSSIHSLPSDVKQGIFRLYAKKMSMYHHLDRFISLKKIEALYNQAHIHAAVLFNQLRYSLL